MTYRQGGRRDEAARRKRGVLVRAPDDPEEQARSESLAQRARLRVELEERELAYREAQRAFDRAFRVRAFGLGLVAIVAGALSGRALGSLPVALAAASFVAAALGAQGATSLFELPRWVRWLIAIGAFLGVVAGAARF